MRQNAYIFFSTALVIIKKRAWKPLFLLHQNLVTVFIRLNDAADGSKIINKRRPRINAAPNQKNAAFTRGYC